MSKLKRKTKEIVKQKREYTRVEIDRCVQEMEKFKINGKWTVKSWMRWAQSKGAIKIYNLENHQFGVILPNYVELQELEEQANRHLGKEEFIERKKVEGLEELSQGMRIQ